MGGVSFDDCEEADSCKVKTLIGKTMNIPLKCDGTIARMKKAIQDREGIPADQQRLVIMVKSWKILDR